MTSLRTTCLFVLIAAAGCGQSTNATPAASDAAQEGLATGPVGPIRLRKDNNFCVDVRDGNTNNNTPVQVFACIGGAAQDWNFSNGSLRSLGKCLTASADLKNGSPLVIADCGAPNQTWNPNINQTIQLVNTTKCIDLPDGKINKDGASPLQLYDCVDVNAEPFNPDRLALHQQFLTLPVRAEGTQIKSRKDDDYCIDVPAGITNNGAAIALHKCNDTHAQRWQSYPDGTLRIDGKCLDDPANSRRAGDALQLWDCVAGSPNQKWDRQGRFIVLSGTDLCVEIPDAKVANDKPLKLWTCNPDNSRNAHQSWEF